MSVLHDFMCKRHGVFESRDSAPECPMKGCDQEVFKVFLKPVGIKSERTKRTDKTVANLASDFGMTNIKSTREGENQAGYHTRNNTTPQRDVEQAAAALQGREPRPGDAAIWGGTGGLNMGSALAGRYARPVHGEPVGVNTATNRMPQVKPSVVLNDHENLKLPPG